MHNYIHCHSVAKLLLVHPCLSSSQLFKVARRGLYCWRGKGGSQDMIISAPDEAFSDGWMIASDGGYVCLS